MLFFQHLKDRGIRKLVNCPFSELHSGSFHCTDLLFRWENIRIYAVDKRKKMISEGVALLWSRFRFELSETSVDRIDRGFVDFFELDQIFQTAVFFD